MNNSNINWLGNSVVDPNANRVAGQSADNRYRNQATDAASQTQNTTTDNNATKPRYPVDMGTEVGGMTQQQKNPTAQMPAVSNQNATMGVADYNNYNNPVMGSNNSNTGTMGNNSGVMGTNTGTMGSNSNVMGTNTGTMGSNSNVMGTNTGTMGSNLNVMGSNTGTMDSNSNVMGSNTGTMGSNSNVMGTNTGTMGSNNAGVMDSSTGKDQGNMNTSPSATMGVSDYNKYNTGVMDMSAAKNQGNMSTSPSATMGVSDYNKYNTGVMDMSAAKNQGSAVSPATQNMTATQGVMTGVLGSGSGFMGAGTTSGGPSLDSIEGPPPVFDREYIAGYLLTIIGRKILAEFIIGNNFYTDKSGTLKEVGVNYFVLQDLITGADVMCDLYSVRFVTALPG